MRVGFLLRENQKNAPPKSVVNAAIKRLSHFHFHNRRCSSDNNTDMARIQINDLPARRALSRLLAAGENPRPILDTIGVTMANRVRLTFRNKVNPYGIPWRPLKPRRGKAARKRGANPQPLQDTRVLFNSIRYRVAGRAVIIGTGVRYGKYHQFGTTTKSGRTHIPARKFLPDAVLPTKWQLAARRNVQEIVRTILGKA